MKKPGWLDEFKTFISRGNVIDLAVGVVVGGARARQEAADRAAITLAEQRTARRLLFTSFESCDLETAERLRLHIPRIRLRSGVRTCNIEPSSYLEELNLGPKQTSGPTDQSHPSA